MTDEDLYEFDSAVRMSDFAAANNGIIKNNAKALSGFASLDASIAALETGYGQLRNNFSRFKIGYGSRPKNNESRPSEPANY